ncbi:MAG: protein-export chaperone SecB [Marinovum sp.]|jgi:preprotein translocase subunit SecB|nr:protein-export chaperone SecB [Marinovum sp.]MEC7206071.1 protein-export chaperone SecB [Pseudomonadota bacterium]NCX69328.1 protein-export chaperone SecB [Paracoccaceae bacterium]OUU12396.1 MAG: protein-export chaperone SecB [Rhodobacteraceae bacterium TMED38]PDH59194.1 MAG: protein-export chaperone SecB [Rhodobacteraceae bacterium MED-G08]|tara:strand:- start:192 stop:680 length:489 start_codon:yes stop_codon:yes gene_type:complete
MAKKTDEITPPKMNILAQYVRDLSFENILAQKGVDGELNPEIQVNVNIDAKKRTTDKQFDVIIKLRVDSKSKNTNNILFVLELDYGGVFQIENVPDDQLHPYLLIECPRMLFPFLRRIVSDVTRDGGFPPLNLENIDFLKLYRQEIDRRKNAKEKNGSKVKH